MCSFLSDVSSKSWARVVVLDVGANNGNWAKSISLLCRQHRGSPCEMAMFEPQPRFASSLEKLVMEIGGPRIARIERAAAWHKDGTLTFFLSKNTEASSVHSSMASKFGKKSEQTTVRSIDLARYMRDTLRLPRSDHDVLSLVKIDVESAEYELLPHLIAERALCGIRYLHIEWHLDALPEEKRLAALGLMLSIHHLLRASCTRAGETAPALIVSEESPNNNKLRVPRLRALTKQHSADPHSALKKANAVRHWPRGSERGRETERGHGRRVERGDDPSPPSPHGQIS